MHSNEEILTSPHTANRIDSTELLNIYSKNKMLSTIC